jgi:hypothetical protein
LQLDECAQLVGERDVRIDAVQLEQLDALQAVQPQALLRLGLHVLGLPVHAPAPCAGSRHARLGRNHQVGRVRVERFVDHPLAHLGAVRIGSVNERHAELDCAAEHADHLVAVAWLAPHSGPGDLHGAVSQPHHGQVAADGELSAAMGRLRVATVHDDAPCPCCQLRLFPWLSPISMLRQVTRSHRLRSTSS